VVDENLRPVVEKFPELGNRILWLARNSEDFREICSDYKECLDALNNSEISGNGGNLVDELGELLESLEDEIRPWLSIGEQFGPVLERFAGDRDRIMRLIRFNPDFRELCQDYLEAMEKWLRRSNECFMERLQKLQELQNEARLWLVEP
jgi:hypothetical protein